MLLNAKHIKWIIIGTLGIIVAIQAIWGHNLYNAEQQAISLVKNEALQTAILREHSYRYEAMGGTIVSNPRFQQGDTARYITKTITLIDTSFSVTFDRYDQYSDIKLSQFILKDHLPVNVGMLDSIFHAELTHRGISDAYTYIEYIDLEDNKVLEQSAQAIKNTTYTPTTLLTIDIFNTIGIRGYIHIPFLSTLKKILVPMVLTALLISMCTFFLIVINRTYSRREKTEQMRQHAVNGMIHEFKRPISVAVSQMALIPYYLEKDNTDRAQKYAEQSLLELYKLDTYTQHIQKISNNDRETILLNKKHVDLHNFFTSLVEKYEKTEEKRVGMSLSITTAQTHVYVDLLHFANVMDNLIENAIKYAKEDGVQIDILVSEEQKNLKISVTDNGVGISAKDLPLIFRKFYRSPNQYTQRKLGFGLGLTYVKALVEAHGGKIKVNSKIGTGTEFIVYFPIESNVELITDHAEQDFINRG